MNDTIVEIYDRVSGTVVASGSVLSMCNEGYNIQWDNLAEEWFLHTYHGKLDSEIEELLFTSDYELALREA